MLRPEKEPLTQGNILIPDTARDKRENKNSLGIGVVLDMGPPALTPLRWDSDAQEWRGGVEVPYDFKIGDRVRHIGQHISRRGEWADEDVVFCSQEEVQCVIDP